MTYKHFFQFNLPAELNYFGLPDHFIDVLATWNSESYFRDGRPMVNTELITLTKSDLYKVKDWYSVVKLIDQIAEDHFKEIARETRFAEARAILSMEANHIQDLS